MFSRGSILSQHWLSSATTSPNSDLFLRRRSNNKCNCHCNNCNATAQPAENKMEKKNSNRLQVNDLASPERRASWKRSNREPKTGFGLGAVFRFGVKVLVTYTLTSFPVLAIYVYEL